MIRFLILLLGVVGGIAAGALVPGLPHAVRSIVRFLHIPGFVASRQTEPDSASQAAREPSDTPADRYKGSGGAEKDILNLTPERIAMARVEVATVQDGRVVRHITVPGTITPAADRIARVPAKVVGIVAELLKRLGDPVVKGEIVAILESREAADARSEYLTASVNLDLQKSAFERAQSLWDKKIVAESQYLQARATFHQAQLRLDLARQKLLSLQLDPNEFAEAAEQANSVGISSLSRYPSRSPASGRVVERKVDVGASVGQQNDPSELYTIVDLTAVWAELAVSTTDLPSLKQGQRVAIISGGSTASGRRAEGRIVFVSPLLEKETRSARVVAEIANPDETWPPGLFVTAEIALEEEAAKVVVPRTALQTIRGETVVFVRAPEGFQKRVVALGRGDHNTVEITAGLQPGETIAVTNSFALKAELGRAQIED